MTDNSANPSLDELESQSASRPTPSVVAPAVGVTPPTATAPIPTSSVTPPIEEVPQRDTVIDPRVVALRALFPDYDDLILISVLESVGGNQDRAIDALLGMSDPEYKAEPLAAVPVQPAHPPLSQTELDEEFARHLMLEEQQQQQQQWVNTNQRPPVISQSHPNQQRQAQPGQGVVADKPMGDFHEQFNRIADSGKRTIGSIFSKVKAKIQEFDQGRSTSGSSTQPTNRSTFGAQGQAQSAAVPQPSYLDSSTQPTWGANTAAFGAQGEAQSAAATQPSYFDPNSHSSLSTTLSSPVVNKSPPAATSAPALKGYDLSPTTSITPPDTPEPLPPSPAVNSSSPRSSSSGIPIDAGKYGLLPKRPVSLLRDPAATEGSGSPPTVSLDRKPTKQSTEDDYGLEYTENPFEEAEKK